MKNRILLILALVVATVAATSPVKKHPDGSVTIDTSTLRAVDGYMGATPLIIHLDENDRVSCIESLPNEETPAYWKLAEEGLSKVWNGITYYLKSKKQ